MAKETSPYRSKLGPLPEEAFENDAISNPEPDTRAGSAYDRLKHHIEARDKKPKR